MKSCYPFLEDGLSARRSCGAVLLDDGEILLLQTFPELASLPQCSASYSDRLASLLHKSVEGSSSGSGSLALGWSRLQGSAGLIATSLVLDVSPLLYLRTRGELLNCL